MLDSRIQLFLVAFKLDDFRLSLSILVFDLVRIFENLVAPLLNSILFIQEIVVLLFIFECIYAKCFGVITVFVQCGGLQLFMRHQGFFFIPLLLNGRPIQSNLFCRSVELRRHAELLHFLHKVHHLNLESLYFAFFW